MHRFLLIVLIVTWLTAVGGGMVWLMHYESTPARATVTASQWPPESNIVRDTTRPTLLMFAHPRCPCTRATLGELSLLMARCHGQVRTYVVFVKPPDVGAGWEQSELWRAAEIPGVERVIDDDGVEASRFSAASSGYALLYGRDGTLSFSGGMTRSRGHAGDNPGRTALTSLITGGTPEVCQTSVFGCPLLSTEFLSTESQTAKDADRD